MASAALLDGENNLENAGLRSGGARRRNDLQIDFSKLSFSNWNNDGVVASHFFNALSLFFPAGEKFFIHSVKCCSGNIKASALVAEVRKFVSQEASHSNVHRLYVAAMVQQGYKVEQLDIRMFSCPLASVKPHWRLSMTVAMEHFTASLSRSLLEYEAVDGNPDLKKLWHWHACEELEHQSVAFDVYQEAVGTGVRAYLLRVAGAIRVSWNFLPRLIRNFASLIEQDTALPKSMCYLKALGYVWGSPGVVRHLIPDFFSYLRPSYRSGEHAESDRELVSEVRERMEIGNGEWTV